MISASLRPGPAAHRGGRRPHRFRFRRPPRRRRAARKMLGTRRLARAARQSRRAEPQEYRWQREWLYEFGTRGGSHEQHVKAGQQSHNKYIVPDQFGQFQPPGRRGRALFKRFEQRYGLVGIAHLVHFEPGVSEPSAALSRSRNSFCTIKTPVAIRFATRNVENCSILNVRF